MSPPVAVFVTDTLPEEAKETLSGFEIFESSADAETLGRCKALICWPGRVTRELLASMKELRMIQTMSAGVDRLEFSAVPAGARVYSNAGAFTHAVAEHAWGLLLGVAKGVHAREERTKPRQLREKTILVIGAGAIGSEVARLAKSLSMKTVGVSRSFREPDAFDEMAPMSEVGSKMAEADAVVMALPLTNKTKGVVDYALLSRAKESVIVVNVGRGDSVVQGDLIRWLRERPESRYATDVFWSEGGRETFKTGAWELPNFAGTLHNSGVPLGDNLTGPKVAAAENVKKFFETGDALNRVDPSDYL